MPRAGRKELTTSASDEAIEANSPISVVSEGTEYDLLLSRIEALELRLQCQCNSTSSGRIIHEEWCPAYVKPLVRYRDCYNCGNSGFVEVGTVGSNQGKLCSVCNGSGKVAERWVNGQLVW